MSRAGHITLAGVVALTMAAPAAATHAGGGATPPSAPEVAPFVRQALARALSAPGARIDSAVEEGGGGATRGSSSSSSLRLGDCRATEAELSQPVEGSGRLAVKVIGRAARGARCEAWIWTRVRVVAPVPVAARVLRAGESLAGAVLTEERELRVGHPPAVIGPESVAVRALLAGQMLEAAVVGEPTLRPGDVVKVLVVSGALVIEQSGRAVPCVRGRSCAVLASGRQVEGDLTEGRLVVQTP